MKTNKILTAAFLLISISAFSQKITMGPRVGATLTKFGNMDNASYKPGLTAGAFLVYSKRENSGLGIELLYSGEGSMHENTIMVGSTTNKYKYDTRLHYIRVPFHATYFFATGEDKVRPKISLGPSVGFLMGTKQKVTLVSTFNETTTETKTENTYIDNYNRLDFGLALGTGLNYKVQSRVWLNFDLRYNYGVMNILKNDAYGESRVNNQGASFSVGVALGIGDGK